MKRTAAPPLGHYELSTRHSTRLGFFHICADCIGTDGGPSGRSNCARNVRSDGLDRIFRYTRANSRASVKDTHTRCTQTSSFADICPCQRNDRRKGIKGGVLLLGKMGNHGNGKETESSYPTTVAVDLSPALATPTGVDVGLLLLGMELELDGDNCALDI